MSTPNGITDELLYRLWQEGFEAGHVVGITGEVCRLDFPHAQAITERALDLMARDAEHRKTTLTILRNVVEESQAVPKTHPEAEADYMSNAELQAQLAHGAEHRDQRTPRRKA